MSGASGLRRASVPAWVTTWALLALATACGTAETTCAKGSVATEDGKCVAVGPAACGPGTEWDEASSTCVLAQTADAGSDAGADTTGADTAGADTAGTDAGGHDAAGGDTSAGEDTALAECKPACDGRVCGDDGCGGTCGDCPNGKVCDVAGQCQSPPDCVPSCTGKVCGGDGCKGSCGTCGDPSAPICKDGKCLAGCVPDCVGKGCGGDGCGGSCGTCGAELACSSHGHCVPKAWTCGADTYAAHNGCDCGCGAPDPDCKVAGQALHGCASTETCGDGGTCVSKVPKGWSCPAFFYDDGLLCNCACGAPDPDCKDTSNTIVDCQPGACDAAAGVCASVCTPSCTGKVCGPDGCGGTCGTCKDPKLPGCAAGACVAKCTPDCSNSQCGDDGCGGSCGTCATGLTCSQGLCAATAGKSCAFHCGYQTSGGCWCDAGCKQRGDCCADVDLCFCTADCTGKSCGDDGCGGSCGACGDKSKPYCDAKGACSATCVPQCAGKSCGDDGCGGTCGACGAGASCNVHGKCVPAEWTCEAHLYASGGVTASCDCSCGAHDPDCAGGGPLTGCPAGGACAKDKAWCEAKWCAKQGDCSKPAWCVGDYPTSAYTRRGVCAPPNPAGFAPNHPCSVDAACASDLCVAGTCRVHCEADKDCVAGQACVGLERYQPLTGKPIGVVGICDQTESVGKSCGKHSDCDKQLCLAFVNPVDLKLVARCGSPHGGAPEGQKCGEGVHCAMGLLCASGVCQRPCLGGQSECASDQTCKPAVVQHGPTTQTSDDTTAPACHAKP